MITELLFAATLLNAGANGVTLKISSETETIDPGRSVFLALELKAPREIKAVLPDLKDRLRGFSVAEDFELNPTTGEDGSVTQCAKWKLVPEPCAKAYGIAPFAVSASPILLSRRSDDGKYSFVAGPVRFNPPPPRETVTGGMECDPEKDMPPITWRLVGWCALALIAVAAVVFALFLGVRYLLRRVKEHRMSPIERARAELLRLIGKGLPGRGRYKDFYVELTMVVRRYIQRKYGIRAPHMTTEEFLLAAKPSEELKVFLESADMVKFAGVKATPEMADEATDSARAYLDRDERETKEEGR